MIIERIEPDADIKIVIGIVIIISFAPPSFISHDIMRYHRERIYRHLLISMPAPLFRHYEVVLPRHLIAGLWLPSPHRIGDITGRRCAFRFRPS